jgi:hypothetical protein
LKADISCRARPKSHVSALDSQHEFRTRFEGRRARTCIRTCSVFEKKQGSEIGNITGEMIKEMFDVTELDILHVKGV